MSVPFSRGVPHPASMAAKMIEPPAPANVLFTFIKSIQGIKGASQISSPGLRINMRYR
ncbi:MAG TPA: hypothetical protein VJX68_06230 [Candidatus Binatus sp.]|uniref:hypothetical protein n=1 Tax=Candidatus Binatus sp. TaxID=2811406 RepID=UPI002B48BF19|nr:hypothetical protein [Candidatus Binatus sp.]HKN12778.1 hypothetical protein [Candidatus Binatus sp.]